jgi:simple sugar transport system ATP-binding protein
MSISDRATVLRGGKVVGTVEAGKMDGQILARMMVGREIGSSAPSLRDASSSVNSLSPRQSESPDVSPRAILEVKEIETVSQHGRPGLQKISCDVHSGEILGIAGVDGNGQTELADTLIGMLPVTSGRILVNGVDVTGFSVKERLRQGIAFIPQDRHAVGLISGFTVAENLILHDHNRPPYSHRGFLSLRFVRSSAEQLSKAYDVRMAGVDALIETLSGGNQQKVVVARELSRNLHLLIALNPTRGVDIGATEEIHMRLRELKRSGTAVVLISTELDEILALSDLLGVLYNGMLMGVVPPETPREEVGLMMAGIKKI